MSKSNHNQDYVSVVKEAIDFLYPVIEPFCRFPNDLKIEPMHTIGKLTLNIKAYDTDYNLIIGKYGVHAHFYRSIMAHWGRKRGNVNIEVQVNGVPYLLPKGIKRNRHEQ